MSHYSKSSKLQEIFILYKAGAFNEEEYNLLKSLVLCCEENQVLNREMNENNLSNERSFKCGEN